LIIPKSFCTVFPSGFATPNSLADRDEDGETGNEAVHHRLGEELCYETEPGQARQEEDDARDKDERGRITSVGRRI
jgi:hypothetical protein